MFQLTPSELEQRRRRCSPLVAKLRKLDREFVTQCNICGTRQNYIIADHDRYGFSIRTALCAHCGLIYMMDRFTPASYSEFYGSGSYRDLVASFAVMSREKKASRSTIKVGNYAADLIGGLQGYLAMDSSARLLDIGGSNGQVAQALVKAFGFTATVLDPSREEIEAAKTAGLDGVIGSIEEWQTDEKFDLILLCKTVEHLYDLRGALTKIRSFLKPGGLFYCDINDYLEISRRAGTPQAISKIDHCFWLTPETAPVIFGATGWQIVSIRKTVSPRIMGVLLSAAEEVGEKPEQQLLPPHWSAQQFRRLREIEDQWREEGKTSPGNGWFGRKLRKLSRNN